MDRSEPSFIPGWLKGTAGGGLATHHNSDEGGFSRSKVTQQLLSVGNNLDSPRKSTSSSSKSFSSTSRRSNGTLDRPGSEREHFGSLGRSKSSLNRSSNRSHKLNLEQNGYKSWINGEYVHEKDYTRQKEWLSGMVPDGRDRDKEIGESASRQLSGLPGKFDIGTKLKRSQSMGLSSRLDSGSAKASEVVSALPSSNGNSVNNLQKTVFEHNFPSLITDDKVSSPRLSTGSTSIASPRPSVSNPHLIWQGNSRSDISRASSPGLVGATGNNAGSEIWSSVLADVPTSNSNVHSSLAANTTSTSNFGQASSSLAVTSAAPLNMAEALTQNPPRVRTPPQLSLECQRLEELALRQSRQLIPVTPSLPKTMSLADKGKSKTPRTVDGPISTSKIQQLNPLHKSTSSSRPDTSKPQGKLLVLKSGKDGVSVSTTSKSDGTQVVPQGNTGLTAGSSAGMSVSATGVLGQRKQDGLRWKDLSIATDDKRLSLHAQNRSDFFNAIRKKAAGNGTNVNASSLSACEAKVDSFKAAIVDNDIKAEANGGYDDPHGGQLSQSNGDVIVLAGNGLIKDSVLEGESKEESGNYSTPGDLEEEEAAFMRSLGWEENAEGSELTEEEINAFYQMCERKKILNGKGNHNYRAYAVDHVVGSVGSMSSGLSSSDSEMDEEVYSNSTRR